MIYPRVIGESHTQLAQEQGLVVRAMVTAERCWPVRRFGPEFEPCFGVRRFPSRVFLRVSGLSLGRAWGVPFGGPWDLLRHLPGGRFGLTITAQPSHLVSSAGTVPSREPPERKTLPGEYQTGCSTRRQWFPSGQEHGLRTPGEAARRCRRMHPGGQRPRALKGQRRGGRAGPEQHGDAAAYGAVPAQAMRRSRARASWHETVPLGQPSSGLRHRGSCLQATETPRRYFPAATTS
jgi:hypothetical protein